MFSLLFAGVLIGGLIYIRVDSCFHLPGFFQAAQKNCQFALSRATAKQLEEGAAFSIICSVGASPVA
jgi:hypothetical protein